MHDTWLKAKVRDGMFDNERFAWITLIDGSKERHILNAALTRADAVLVHVRRLYDDGSDAALVLLPDASYACVKMEDLLPQEVPKEVPMSDQTRCIENFSYAKRTVRVQLCEGHLEIVVEDGFARVSDQYDNTLLELTHSDIAALIQGLRAAAGEP